MDEIQVGELVIVKMPKSTGSTQVVALVTDRVVFRDADGSYNHVYTVISGEAKFTALDIWCSRFV